MIGGKKSAGSRKKAQHSKIPNLVKGGKKERRKHLSPREGLVLKKKRQLPPKKEMAGESNAHP